MVEMPFWLITWIIIDAGGIAMIKHPGQLVKSLCLEPLNVSVTEAAQALHVSHPTLSKLVNGHIGISPEMAMRLAMAFGTSEELWINLQSQYDLWKARQRKKHLHVKRLSRLDKAA